jgi:hypothetical protein
MRVETTVGPCSLRKRGSTWYARIQRKRHRWEVNLGTGETAAAIAVAQERIPAVVLGRQILLSPAGVPNESYYRGMYADIRARAKKLGYEFSLTEQDWQDLVSRASGRCELTGIVFSLAKSTSSFRAPYAPSVDRIDASKGYTAANVRFVCCSVNYALQDWGIGVFDAMCLAYASKRLADLAGDETEHGFRAS